MRDSSYLRPPVILDHPLADKRIEQKLHGAGDVVGVSALSRLVPDEVPGAAACYLQPSRYLNHNVGFGALLERGPCVGMGTARADHIVERGELAGYGECGLHG